MAKLESYGLDAQTAAKMGYKKSEKLLSDLSGAGTKIPCVSITLGICNRGGYVDFGGTGLLKFIIDYAPDKAAELTSEIGKLFTTPQFGHVYDLLLSAYALAKQTAKAGGMANG